MATITEPILLDSTGQDIVTALGGIASALTPTDTVKADSVYPTETSPTTHAYSEGDHLIVDGITYIAIDDIAIGDSLTIGTNIQSETLGTRMNHIDDVVDELFGKKAVYTVTKNGTRTYGDVMNLLYANVNFTINSKIVVDDGSTLDIYPISLWADTRKRFTRTIAGSGNSALEVVTWDIRNSNAKFSKTVVASNGTVTVTDLTSNIAETVKVYDLA